MPGFFHLHNAKAGLTLRAGLLWPCQVGKDHSFLHPMMCAVEVAIGLECFLLVEPPSKRAGPSNPQKHQESFGNSRDGFTLS